MDGRGARVPPTEWSGELDSTIPMVISSACMVGFDAEDAPHDEDAYPISEGVSEWGCNPGHHGVGGLVVTPIMRGLFG